MHDGCPKCGTPKSADACPKCGLVFAKFDPESARFLVPEALAEAWSTVERQWEEPSAHALFIEACSRADRLDFAARVYTERAGDPVADAQKERIVRRVERSLGALSESRPTHDFGRLLTVVLLMGMLIGAFYLLFFHTRMP